VKTLHALELVALGAIWGGSFLFTRIAVPEWGIPALIAVRVIVSALILAPWLVARESRAGLRGRWGAIFVLGLINTAIPFSLLAFTVQHIGAGFASILNATAALFGALLAWAWLGERLQPLRVAGLVIGFAGVVLLSWHKLGFSQAMGAWPVLSGLGGGFLYGLSLNFTKRYLTGVAPLSVAAGSQVTAALVLLPVLVIFAPRAWPSAPALWSAAALGVLCTGIAYVLFYRLFSAIGPTRALTVAFLIPMFGVLWGWFFLKEQFTMPMALGACAVLLGMGLTTGIIKAPARKPAPSTEPA
jgi:drug/metabolite transporter (DMT)-like permease